MTGNTELSIAMIGAGAAIGGGVLTWLLGQVSNLTDYRRKKNDERDATAERSRAVLHGSFSVCNFLAEKLNDWDESKNVADLARLTVAQPYIARLIDRSPQENEILSVSLIDLGLRLESLLFVIGRVVGEQEEFPASQIGAVDDAAGELGSAVELVQLLLNPDPAMISEEELAEMVTNPEAIGQTTEGNDESN
ncbi:hypothetical protein [Pseudoblastomonas halimionae]|uniref:Uncharacterized protein n=1 Tax=Alteriqipengyuania halimionae TaxID=1926630 RepID=A0A6I4TZD5_9SPHN|nr:hypothetical protein [Alteriqipengyuania halimionae]MXP09070.1 hypothetical protein [Alteriqipengyuania halimionae]